ncbi:MAG: SUMF1/EgtB/PvdO family nonheme iron enzyme [Bacteroidetes bacterium]|nr:SUMF1/EgtB/PvdO family nonheme iron enzyme [Bacteroidota bacterium]
MKKLLLLIILTAISFSFIERKKKEFTPPGTVKICDTLFVDETEISNFSWVQYELWIARKYGVNSTEHKAVLPDTLVWREKYATNEPYVKYYYRHPAYRDYPVVGISYEQALAFCKWRTERVKEFMIISKKYQDINFEYRLPSKSEWEFLSNNGSYSDGYSVFSRGGRNEKGLVTFNHRWAKDSAEWVSSGGDKSRVGMEVLAPVYSYWPNYFKLYNMIGNASEMVLEKGISKGGSWRNLLEECRVGKDIPYEKPTAWLGFRCVCIVKKSAV